MSTDVKTVIDLIESEYYRAVGKFPPFNSAHEGFAVIKEEYDELWDEVKRNPIHPAAMEKEAIQLGAMVLRFLIDVVGKEKATMDSRAEIINQIIDEEAVSYVGTCGYSRSMLGKSHFFPALGIAISKRLDRLKEKK